MFTSFVNWIKSLFSYQTSYQTPLDEGQLVATDHFVRVTHESLVMDVTKSNANIVGWKGVRVLISDQPVDEVTYPDQYWFRVDDEKIADIRIHGNGVLHKSFSAIHYESGRFSGNAGILYVYIDSCLPRSDIHPKGHRFEVPYDEQLMLSILVLSSEAIYKGIADKSIDPRYVLMRSAPEVINLRY